MKNYYCFLVALGCIMASSCSIPMNSYRNVGKSIDMNQKSGVSVVASVESSATGLARELSRIIPDTVAEGDYEEYDMEYRVFKKGDLEMQLAGRILNIAAPLKIAMKKSLLFGDAEAEGLIKLNLESEYNVSPSWKISANSKLVGHEWIEKPVLKFGIIKIPVESLTDFVLNQIEDKLLSELDRALAEEIELSKEIKKMQDYVLKEFQYDYENKYLAFVPKEMKASGFRSEGDLMRVQLGMEGNLEINDELLTVDKTDTIIYSPMVYNGNLDHSKATLRVSEKDIQQLAVLYLDKNPIDMGEGRSIKLNDTRISLNKKKIEVATDATGFIEGPIYITGDLDFNSSKNQVELNNFNFKANIKGVVKRVGISLVKSRIKSELENSLNEFVWEYVNEYNNSVRDWSASVEDEYPLRWNPSGLEISLDDIKFDDNSVSLILRSKETLRLLFKD